MRRGGTPFTERYGPEDLRIFTREEARRFLAPGAVPDRLPAPVRWELLYRLEPWLYHRLAMAEPLHPEILDWLPEVGLAVEVAAGTGRLTLELASRCRRLLAVEPCAAMRRILRRRLRAAGRDNVTVMGGYFDRLPVADGAAELVVACSALTDDPGHGGEGGLREMERACAPGGRVVIIWPTQPAWLEERGYRHVTFRGRLLMEFRSHREAVELTSIFYPRAAEAVRAAGRARVPYTLLGNRPPADVAWKSMPAA